MFREKRRKDMHLTLEQIKEFLPFLIPLIIAEVVLIIVTLRHILTHENYKHGNRAMWIVITLVGMQLWGPILYFVFGKEEE